MQSLALKIGIAGIAACAVTYGTWRLLAGPDWSNAVSVVVDVMNGADAEQLSDYLHQEELAAFKLGRKDAVSVIRKVIQPTLHTFRTSRGRAPPLEVGSKVVVPLVVSWGENSLEQRLVVTKTPDGPRILIGQLAVICLRLLQERGERGQLDSWRAEFAVLAARFASEGVVGYWDIQSGQIEEWPLEAPNRGNARRNP